MSASPERTIEMTMIVQPFMVNFFGNLYGGELLKWLDGVAYACSSRYAGKPTVTLSVDQVFFKEPIYIGELLIASAAINYVGKTSMEVGIKIFAENLEKRTRRHTNTCYFTMVAMGDDGRPAPIPAYTPITDDDKRRFDEAEQRRDLRMRHRA